MSYYLKKPPNKDGSALIYLQKNYHAIRLIISTGLNIKPEFWDKRTERVKRQFKYSTQYNAILDKYEDVTERSYLEMRINGVPSKEALKAEVLRRMEPNRPETIHEYTARYATKYTTYSSQQTYSRLSEIIKEFDPKLTFADLSREVMEDFRDWMLAKKWEVSTVGKVYQRFKTVCNDATERGVNTRLDYRTRKVSVSPKDTTQIFLDEAELTAMWKLKLTGKIELARDLFMVLAWCGTRYSDLWHINRSSFYNEDNMPHFRILDEKQGNQATIPAHPVVLAIMTKYNWQLPKLANNRLNEFIKEVGLLAKIDREIVETSHPGGVRKDRVVKKYELIKTHSGRRSLICNLILANYNDETIMKISGHKSFSAYRRYIRLTPQHHLEIAFKTNFFKGVKLKSV